MKIKVFKCEYNGICFNNSEVISWICFVAAVEVIMKNVKSGELLSLTSRNETKILKATAVGFSVHFWLDRSIRNRGKRS